MAIQRRSRAFKDISLSFDVHPVTKDLTVLTAAGERKCHIETQAIYDPENKRLKA